MATAHSKPQTKKWEPSENPERSQFTIIYTRAQNKLHEIPSQRARGVPWKRTVYSFNKEWRSRGVYRRYCLPAYPIWSAYRVIICIKLHRQKVVQPRRSRCYQTMRNERVMLPQCGALASPHSICFIVPKSLLPDNFVRRPRLIKVWQQCLAHARDRVCQWKRMVSKTLRVFRS